MGSNLKYITLSILISSLFFTFNSIRNEYYKKTFLVFVLIFIIIVSYLYAWRIIDATSGGVDTLNYKYVFDSITRDIDSILAVRFEKGYALFYWITKNIIGSSFNYFLFLYCITILLLTLRLTSLLSKRYSSIFSYLLISLFIIDSFNIARMIIALLVLFFCIKYITERKYFKALMITTIAASFQMVMIWGVILIFYDYFMRKIKGRWYFNILLAFSFMIPILLIPTFKNILVMIDYGYYISSSESISYFNYIFVSILLIIVFISKKHGGVISNIYSEKILFLLPTVFYVIPLYFTVPIAYRFNYIYMLMVAFVIPDILHLIKTSKINTLTKMIFTSVPILYFLLKYISYMLIDVQYAQDWLMLNNSPL